MSTLPDYYSLLNVPRSASQEEIRQAYKKASLRTHPDRLVNATHDERKRATEKFQAIADAYYVLSDPRRRKEYDLLYSSRPSASADSNASANFFTQFASMFSDAGNGAGAPPNEAPHVDPDGVFSDVFQDLLQPEVERHMPWWAWLGAVCGAGLGFIVANVPGLVAGAIAGNRLGAIRDAKGKSVAAVFTQLSGNQRAEILRALALKVLGSAL